MLKKKFRNKGLWLSLISTILLALQAAGVIESASKYDELVNTVLTLLVGLGIFSSPKEGNWYKDGE
jgi:uncharacterized membrane protein